MIWKLSIYLLLIALPAGVVTSIVDIKETRNEISSMISENENVKTDGAIMGSIIAPNAAITIKGINGNKTIKGNTNSNGEFFIKGFKEGTYEVIVEAEKENQIESYTFNDVVIKIGEVTALGTVTME